MHIIDALLLVVKREGKDGLHGRTLLQKKLYFLSVLQNVNFGFSAHYYGPYSSFVAEHLNGLVEDGIFKEVTEFFTTDSTERNDLGEMRRHTYFLTDEGRRGWKSTQKKNDFPKWDETLRKINSQEIANNFNLLSIAAKVHYIIDWEGEKSVKEVCQTAKEYGWDFTEKDIAKVLSFLTEMGLVTTDES
jgi:uncharacterized protein YwgA